MINAASAPDSRSLIDYSQQQHVTWQWEEVDSASPTRGQAMKPAARRPKAKSFAGGCDRREARYDPFVAAGLDVGLVSTGFRRLSLLLTCVQLASPKACVWSRAVGGSVGQRHLCAAVPTYETYLTTQLQTELYIRMCWFCRCFCKATRGYSSNLPASGNDDISVLRHAEPKYCQASPNPPTMLLYLSFIAHEMRESYIPAGY